MHNNNNYQCKMCWNKALTFGVGSIKLSFCTICSLNTCKGVFNPNVTTFQSNCAEGLHFSAFSLFIALVLHNLRFPAAYCFLHYCLSIAVVTTSEWSEWSECTEPCGGGTQFRTRTCRQGNSSCETDEQSCNTEDCDPEPELQGEVDEDAMTVILHFYALYPTPSPIYIPGLGHVGCYWVPAYSNLFFLEGSTSDLSDNPLQRKDPIRKCGVAAQLYNFNIFGVSVGYCISGSNNLLEYQRIETGVCEQGVGEQGEVGITSICKYMYSNNYT